MQQLASRYLLDDAAAADRHALGVHLVAGAEAQQEAVEAGAKVGAAASGLQSVHVRWCAGATEGMPLSLLVS